MPIEFVIREFAFVANNGRKCGRSLETTSQDETDTPLGIIGVDVAARERDLLYIYL